MYSHITRRTRIATLASTALLSLTLGVGGQFLAVGSAAAAGADDAARIPRVSVARPQIEISGIVSALGAGTITINGKTVTIASAELSGVLVVGARVKLHATVAADGSLQAREVRVLARPAVPAAPAIPAAPAAPAADDHGVDKATHDANDDHGTDGATHDANDDHGTDGATHDAGDDKGGSGGDHRGGGNGGNGGHGGKDDGGKHK